MAKKKAAVPKDAAPSEDAYVEPVAEPEGADYSEPEVAASPMPKTALPPSAETIADMVLKMATEDGCADYKACAAELKRAQDAFGQAWHKAYS